MSEDVDVVDALVSLLKADAAITAIAGTNVFGTSLPDEITGTDAVAALVVSFAGGAQALGGGYMQHGDVRCDTKAYGRHPGEAVSLNGAAKAVLKGLRRQVVEGVLLHWARPVGGPLSLLDPDLRWPYVLHSWQVYSAEIPIP